MPLTAALSRLIERLRGWRARPLPWPTEELADATGERASAETLKEVVERKRRHEQVRQREFDHLRQLRQRGIGAGERSGAAAASGLSRWDSVLSGMPQERERTLRKIDQAEAQMVRSWWRPTRPGARPAPVARPEVRAPRVSDTTLQPDTGFAPTVMPAAAAASAAPARTMTAAAEAARPAPVPISPFFPEPDARLAQEALRWARGSLPAARGAWPVTAGATEPPLALSGVLCGDIDAVLAALAARMPAAATHLEIGCGALARVDFAAAGCLLDWVQAQQARGCRVQLREVSPLVAAFLHMIGLGAHADIVPRAVRTG